MRSLLTVVMLMIVLAACSTTDEDMTSTRPRPDIVISTTASIAPTSTRLPSTTGVTTTTTTSAALATTTTTTTAPTTTTTTTSAPDQPVLCRDLGAAGYSYADAVEYWLGDGAPERMDADRNGIPCETVYRTAEIASYLDTLTPVCTGYPYPTALSRDLVPWDRVAAGWYLAPFVGSDHVATVGDELEFRPTVLYLLNERGVIYELASWEPGTVVTLMDWHPGGRQALISITEYAPQTKPRIRALLVDLTTMVGRRLETTTLDYQMEVHRYEFTRPTGRNLVRYVDDGETERLQRLNPQGELLAELAEQPTSDFVDNLTWLYRYDGTGLIVSGETGMREITNQGELVADIRLPQGMARCRPRSWWDRKTIVAECRSNDPEVLPHEFFSELWLIDITDNSSRALTHRITEEAWKLENVAQYFGAHYALPTPAGILIAETADCGGAWVATIDDAGSIIGGISGNALVGVHERIAVTLNWQDCSGRPGSLAASSIEGEYLYDLIRVEDPIYGVHHSVASLDQPGP